jgi:hypothetical protein
VLTTWILDREFGSEYVLEGQIANGDHGCRIGPDRSACR